MLSYQHIYHAGNLADVQKHSLLAWMLDYMCRKDKPLSYLESHAGRGLYALDDPHSLKTGEAEKGVLRAQSEGWFSAQHPYQKALSKVREAHGPMAYPGSPMVAAKCLRAMDTIHLAELHPQEYSALEYTMSPHNAKIHHADGFQMMMGIAPPTPRRGLMMIDPSYEIKEDYDTIPDYIAKMHRKWNVGVIALWYPILATGAHKSMINTLKSQNLKGAYCHEVRFEPARQGHAMIGSGMFIVNAPYGLEAEGQRLSKLFAGLKKASSR